MALTSFALFGSVGTPLIAQGNLARHESYTSFGDSMLIAFYLAVMIFRICCLTVDSGRKSQMLFRNLARHESYTSFGDSMLTAFYLVVMIFRRLNVDCLLLGCDDL
ncbi:hypothetical protein Tco_0865341 [Tanacetum coccineum]